LGQFDETIADLRKMKRDLADLQNRRAELKSRPEAIDGLMLDVRQGYGGLLLPYSVAGRLAMDQAIEVVPLDDEGLLQAAKPIRPDGMVNLDPAKLEARHGGQVRAALASGPSR
jgi:hypothetical protein